MSRQHAVPAQPRQRTPRSSVWIDPAVSTYLQGDEIEQSSPALSPPVEPASPIPQRASAHRLRAVNVRPRYSYNRVQVSEESDLADVPTVPPPTTWQYESQAYMAESSLSNVSLIVDTPTQPQTPSPAVRAVPSMPETPPQGMPRIEEMDTRPPVIAKSTIHGIVDSTLSEPQQVLAAQHMIPVPLRPVPLVTNAVSGRALAPLAPAALPTVPTVPAVLPSQNRQHAGVELASWTAGDAAGSRYAQLVAARTGRQKGGTSFNLFDRLRWWLLHPGRFEFLLWLGGTILLMTVTCIVILMTAFSLQGNNTSTPSSSITSSPVNGPTSSPGLSLVLTNTGSLVAGQPLHLHGQGFSANGHIAFVYDASKPFLNQEGQPVLAQSDARGAFVVTLNSPPWGAGQHRIVARDLATGHQATTSITVVAATKMTTATPAVTTPVVTATASQQGNNVPPVGQTPPVVPTSPTGITPTATPRPPTPTPTVGITPTATVGTTPTVTVTPKLGGTATVGITPTVGNTNPAVLNAQYVAASGETAIPVSPWLWLLIGGYALAMLLFGLAGLVHTVQKRS